MLVGIIESGSLKTLEEGRRIDAVPAKPLKEIMWRWEQGGILTDATPDHLRHITANATEELKIDGFRSVAYVENGYCDLSHGTETRSATLPRIPTR